MSTFLKASKKKLRFATSKGELSTEQLWDLSLTSLDTIAKAVNKRIKDSEEESFIGKKTSGNADDELRLEVLKEVIRVKMEDQDKRAKASERAEKLRHLKQLATEKQTEAFGNQSLEEIQKQIAELSAMDEES